MDRCPVTSSSLVSLGYDEQARVLEVEFTGGKVYRYFDVPRCRFEELMSADSRGGYLNSNVKPFHRYAAV